MPAGVPNASRSNCSRRGPIPETRLRRRASRSWLSSDIGAGSSEDLVEHGPRMSALGTVSTSSTWPIRVGKTKRIALRMSSSRAACGRRLVTDQAACRRGHGQIRKSSGGFYLPIGRRTRRCGPGGIGKPAGVDHADGHGLAGCCRLAVTPTDHHVSDIVAVVGGGVCVCVCVISLEPLVGLRTARGPEDSVENHPIL